MSTFKFVALAPSLVLGSLEKPSIAIAAARADAISILDASSKPDFSEITTSLDLITSTVPDGKIGLRLSEEGLQSFLSQLNPKTPWLIGQFQIILYNWQKHSVKESVAQAHRANFNIIGEAHSLAEARELQAAGVDILLARGQEASGLVGSSTAFILTQELVKEFSLPIWVQGGVGEHTVAAIQAAGAKGVVLDSQLYLAKDSLVPDSIKNLISSMDGTETRLIAGPEGKSYRLYVRKSAQPLDLQINSTGMSPQKYCHSMEETIIANNKFSLNLLPIGQDAAFASRLAERGNTVAGIIALLRDSVENYPLLASKHNMLANNSPLASSHQTRYPIVQGAMTRVSDNANFANAVAEEGALPFLALSLMRKRELENLLETTSELLQNKSWGVGILGFLPNQLRLEQMEVIKRFKPPFALIAGGRPDQAQAFEEAGTKTYLHVPSPLILKSFIEMGATSFVFEGNECGGHIGPRSSFVLWEQMVSVLLDSIPSNEDYGKYHILFAGGIHDSLSAKMVATMAAPLSEKGIKAGVLVGTAYLYTEEATKTGAIVEEFQKRAVDCQETVLLETGPGHAIRCVNSPYKQEFEARKAILEDGNKSKTTIKEELELLHLGRLRIASKGLERKGKDLARVNETEQFEKGMYMIGQLASMKSKIGTIKELHEDISSKGSQLLDIQDKTLRIETIKTKNQDSTPKESIAIIGMSCNLPLSNDIEKYWRNIIEKVDAIEEVPESHWNWKNFYDPNRFATDKAISKWGGYIKDIVFNPSVYGIPPKSLDSIDPVQLLMLEVVRQALEDAGYSQRKYPKKKASMLLANAGHGPVAARYAIRCMLDNELDGLIDEDTKAKIREKMPEWTEDSLPGNLSNVTAGRVANRFDLGGLNFCVDAACASSLAALYVGMNELRSGSSDLVIVGSADTHNNPIDFLNFSKTHALSESGRCKTFDASADGIVLGEGIAALVLKRLSDAEKDGDNIYALIRGIGGSSDGRALSLTAPRPLGQVVALNRAYEDSGVCPSTIGLVEAHGTGTVAGDRAEVEALSQVFSEAGASQNSCAIGSVKTNIGHTKCTAGLASTIKVAKALHHKVLPPTIGVQEANPACNFGQNPFYINSEPRPWINNSTKHPRRAAVSAFGFGGTNFHTVLEEYIPPITRINNFISSTWPTELFVYRAGSASELANSLKKTLKDLEAFKKAKLLNLDSEAISIEQVRLTELSRRTIEKATGAINGSHSIAVLANTLEDLEDKLNSATMLLKEDGLELTKPAKNLVDIYYNHTDTFAKGKLGILFPGQGSQRVNMLKELAFYFPEIRQQLESFDQQLEGRLDKGLSSYVYPIPCLNKTDSDAQQKDLDDTRIAQPALGAANIAILKVLKSLGIEPDMVAGHSYGEYVALWAAGCITEEALIELSFIRGQILGATKENGSMLAVFAGLQEVTPLIDQSKGVTIANQNSPTQTIVSGSSESLESFAKLARTNGISVKPVAVSCAFHSPMMRPAKMRLANELDAIDFSAPRIPIYRNANAEIYPDDGNDVKKILVEHITDPVMFRDQLTKMKESGVNIFVECGPGSILTSLVESNFPDRSVKALCLDRVGKNGLAQFLATLAELWSLGVNLDLARLHEGRSEKDVFQKYERTLEDRRHSKLNYYINSINVQKAGESQIGSNGSKESSEENEAKKSHLEHQSKLLQKQSEFEKFKSPLSQKDKNGNGNKKPSLNNTLKTIVGGSLQQPDNVNLQLQKTNPSGIYQTGAVEQVLLAYQENLLNVTNNYIQAQKEAMLAYLESSNAKPSIGTPETKLSKLEYNNSQGTNGKNDANQIHLFDAIQENQLQVEVTNQQNKEDTKETKQADYQLNTDCLIENLYEIVSERTGYPLEMLDPGLDLEADLGIDSIKRIEIFNNFRKELPESFKFELEGNIEELAELKTLDSISEWIRKLDNLDLLNANLDPASRQADYIKDAIKTMVDENSEDNPKATASIRRETVKLSTGVATRSQLKEPAPQKVLIFCEGDETSDSGKLNKILKEFFQAKSIKVDQISVNPEKMNSHISEYFTSTSRERLPNWIFCLSQKAGLLTLAKELKLINQKDRSYSPSLIVGTSMGGDLLFEGGDGASLDHIAENGALAGMTNTIALELDFIRAFYFDYSSSDLTASKSLASRVFDLALTANNRGEYALGEETVRSPFIVPSPLKIKSTKRQTPLNASSLVLVTGGARGITAELTIELAKEYGCNFVILGQSEKPGTESTITAGIENPKDIKAALLSAAKENSFSASIREIESSFKKLIKEREIVENLDKIREYASSVKYFSIDVRDDIALSNFVDSIYELNDTIDGVIHGAGVIEDAHIQNKSVDSFNRVFDTKVKGALTLSQKLRLDDLKFFFFLSSVVGRTGNPGQIDYVAANEALNKLATKLNRNSKCVVKSIMWGPWRAGMAPEELERVFESYGWGMIDPKAGREAFLDELHYGSKEQAEVIIVGNPLKSTSVNNALSKSYSGPVLQPATIVSRNPLKIELPIERSNHIYLEDHKLDSIPVLPMAMAVEVMLEAATLALGGLPVKQITDFYIPHGVVFDTDNKLFEVSLEQKDSELLNVAIHSINGTKNGAGMKKLHHRAVIDFSETEKSESRQTNQSYNTELGSKVTGKFSPDLIIDSEPSIPSIRHIYQNWLFHGPRFQGIESIESLGLTGIAGRIRSLRPTECLSNPGINNWCLDPTLFDSAMQLGAVWARHYSDITCLPTGFKSMRFIKPLTSQEAYVHVFTVDKTFDGEVVCDLAIYDSDRELCILVESLAGIGSKSFNRFASSVAKK